MNLHNQPREQPKRLCLWCSVMLGGWLLSVSTASGQAVTPRPLPTNNTYQMDQIVSSAYFDDQLTARYWTFAAAPGQQLTLEVDRSEMYFDPLVWIFAGSITSASHFDLGQVEFIDASDPGFLALADDGIAPLIFPTTQTQDPRITLDLPPGATTFTVLVTSFLSGLEENGVFSPEDGGDGLYDYRIRASLSQVSPPAVVGRHVFYNNSAFDGNNAAATSADASAIAIGKEAYRAGDGRAQYKHYTNYSRGINGIMVDIADMPGTPTEADFLFRVGNSNNTGNWDAPPAFTVASVVVTRGAGVLGSDRVTIIFADNAIRNQWLQVSVLANAATTGLAAADVHYWGHQAGEVNNEPGLTRVNPADTSRIGANFSGFAAVPTSSPYDLNRDGRINTQDYSYSQSTYSGFSSLLLVDF